jgi:hypothetical protein
LALSVKNGHKNNIFGVLYKSPQENNEDFVNYFEEFCDKLMIENKIVYICGDFNVNYLSDSNTKSELETIASARGVESLGGPCEINVPGPSTHL